MNTFLEELAVGLGRIGLALLSVLLTWLVLALAGVLEGRIAKGRAAADAGAKH